jgi:pSer/pThr/pTyr-binding forkhead associated (FHA) protein
LPKVTITQGPDAGKTYDIERAAILGRLESNDIPVHDKKASREHAKIYRQGQNFAVVDLNSSNGTYVNGEQITKRVLKTGDEITIGVVHLLFEFPEADEAESAPKRKSLDEAFESAASAEKKPGAAADDMDRIQLTGHQPLQYSRVRSSGSSGIGFDLEQLSPVGRMMAYLFLVGIFAGLIYLGYVLVS